MKGSGFGAESLERLAAIGAVELAVLRGERTEAELVTAASAVQIIGKIQLEALPAAQRREQRRTMPTRALAVARKRATHRALVSASFGHPPSGYFVIGSFGQPPYSLLMPPLSRCYFSVFSATVAVLGLAAGCAKAPAESRDQAPLGAGQAPATPLAAGAPAPDVTFPVHTGESIQLASLRGKPVIVYFYPKDDTPGCTVEAQEIRDLYQQLQGTGAVVIGVSTDGRDSHRAFAEKHTLPFLLASDESGAIARAFGVPLKNGRASRVSFVVGADGRIKRSFPSVTPKGHAQELLSAISS